MSTTINTKSMKYFLSTLCVLLLSCWWGRSAVIAQCNAANIEVVDTLEVDFEEGEAASTLMINAKGVKMIKLLLYNRKGEKVFESSSSIMGATKTNYRILDTGWDGTQMGVPLRPDVYLYMIEADCVDQQMVYKSGMIELVERSRTQTQGGD